LLKRAMKGKLDLLTPAMAVAKELLSIPDFNTVEETAFSTARQLVVNMKKSILLVAGTAVQKLMQNLHDEQEIIMNIADMIILAFNAESALLRLMKIANPKNTETFSVQEEIVFSYLHDAIDQLHKQGKDAINAFTEGDEQKILLLGLKRFTKTTPYNSKDARRKIAHHLILENKYTL